MPRLPKRDTQHPENNRQLCCFAGSVLCPFRGATNLKNNVLQSSVKLPMDCVILFRKEPDGPPADGGSSDSAGSQQTLL